MLVWSHPIEGVHKVELVQLKDSKMEGCDGGAHGFCNPILLTWSVTCPERVNAIHFQLEARKTWHRGDKCNQPFGPTTH